MRSQSGMTLLEMVVAVGLSGVFVCLLSGLLGQTLALSSASQNELAAANSADLLLENAKSIPFSYYESATLPTTVTLVASNPPDPPGQISPTWRPIPFQIDLTNPALVYGTVNGGTGIVNSSTQWQQNKGNYFHANGLETIEDGSPWTQFPPGKSVRITVTVNYAGSATTTPTKSVTRQAFLFEEGASF